MNYAKIIYAQTTPLLDRRARHIPSTRAAAGTVQGMLTLARLTQVAPEALIDLMNDPRVRRHMPLATGVFGPAECTAWVAAKEAMWHEHGYGPWAFLVDGEFAGWGGLQPEDGDADLALVLRQAFWGHGRAIAERVLAEAFGPLALPAVTVLLPPSRRTAAAVLRLGFRPDGEIELAGRRFHRFRRTAPAS
ncbi:GNAT family N-acetyltransferase [Dactylosporangium matsuzakiense]|nr:GNAT family protein [Dactylosporangium matsuzakiense]UWZ41139.1 GNAT family N-acetyltransferase [Dactylosporangium matsuzakiense]